MGMRRFGVCMIFPKNTEVGSRRGTAERIIAEWGQRRDQDGERSVGRLATPRSNLKSGKQKCLEGRTRSNKAQSAR